MPGGTEDVSALALAIANYCQRLDEVGVRLLHPYCVPDAYGRKRAPDSRSFRLRTARSCFEKSLRIVPSGLAPMLFLGRLYQVLDNHETALVWFQRTIDACAPSPVPPVVKWRAGEEALACGRFGLALEYFRDACAARPAEACYHSYLALALVMNGSFDQAFQTFCVALRLSKENRHVQWVGRALLMIEMGLIPQPERLEGLLAWVEAAESSGVIDLKAEEP